MMVLHTSATDGRNRERELANSIRSLLYLRFRRRRRRTRSGSIEEPTAANERMKSVGTSEEAADQQDR